jgi:hypothetical protein
MALAHTSDNLQLPKRTIFCAKAIGIQVISSISTEDNLLFYQSKNHPNKRQWTRF